jgi:hypothetical protein
LSKDARRNTIVPPSRAQVNDFQIGVTRLPGAF